ncbi:hypothetical protein CEUSTIGMA_g10762.t1, partial [Chlamydomonas eustigma]
MGGDGASAGIAQMKRLELKYSPMSRDDEEHALDIDPRIGSAVYHHAMDVVGGMPMSSFSRPVFPGIASDAETPPKVKEVRVQVPQYKTDAQNVHDHGVVQTTAKNLDLIPSDPRRSSNDAIAQVMDSVLKSDMSVCERENAIRVLDSLSTNVHTKFGRSEAKTLADVWDVIRRSDTEQLRKNLEENLVKQLATGVEDGSVVCSTGKIARITSSLEGSGLGLTTMRPLWAIRDELGTLAAKTRDQALLFERIKRLRASDKEKEQIKEFIKNYGRIEKNLKNVESVNKAKDATYKDTFRRLVIYDAVAVKAKNSLSDGATLAWIVKTIDEFLDTSDGKEKFTKEVSNLQKLLVASNRDNWIKDTFDKVQQKVLIPAADIDRFLSQRGGISVYRFQACLDVLVGYLEGNATNESKLIKMREVSTSLSQLFETAEFKSSLPPVQGINTDLKKALSAFETLIIDLKSRKSDKVTMGGADNGDSGSKKDSEESTGKPKESTGKPKESTDKPKESTDKPKESTDKPKESTDKPKEFTDKPKESTIFKKCGAIPPDPQIPPKIDASRIFKNAFVSTFGPSSVKFLPEGEMWPSYSEKNGFAEVVNDTYKNPLAEIIFRMVPKKKETEIDLNAVVAILILSNQDAVSNLDVRILCLTHLVE